jgi:hypothetical protein
MYICYVPCLRIADDLGTRSRQCVLTFSAASVRIEGARHGMQLHGAMALRERAFYSGSKILCMAEEWRSGVQCLDGLEIGYKMQCLYLPKLTAAKHLAAIYPSP